MYRTVRTIPEVDGKNTFTGIPTQEDRQGSQQSQAGIKTAREPANDFLTAVFKPVFISDYDPVYSRQNYNYLYDSAKNYAHLSGKTFNPAKRYRDFEKLYKAFIKILPDEIYCEIIQDNDYLMFQLLDDKDERTIYHIPCKIIDEAKGVLREIYICFFSLLCKTQGIEKLTDNPIYEIYTFDLPKEGEEIDKDDEWMVTLNEYENGKIAQTLKTVFEKPKYTIRQLKNRIKKYVPADERESKILSRMSEGLELFKVGKNIMNYAFFPKEDEDFYDSYYPVPITRFFNIIYEFHDLVSENLNQWISDNANENGYEYLVGAEDIISPQTKALLKADDYVEKFLKWINDFCDELHD